MDLEGDAVALRLCMDRICPPLKNRLVAFPLPPINTARDAAHAMSVVMNAVAEGRLTPADAAEISKVVACTVKASPIGFRRAPTSQNAIRLLIAQFLDTRRAVRELGGLEWMTRPRLSTARSTARRWINFPAIRERRLLKENDNSAFARRDRAHSV